MTGAASIRAPFGRGSGGPEQTAALAGAAAILVSCVGFFYFAASTNPDTWVPVLVVVVLVAISIPLILALSGRPSDRRLRRILLLSLVLKLLFTGPRYYLNEVYYKGEGDAARYHQAGGYLVQNLEEGKFSIEGSELTAFPAETRLLGYVTGVLYLVFGTSFFGGYLVFSWVAWLGLLCFCRSFQIAYPNAPPYVAFMSILFFPSLLFWPSSIGKEAIMIFLLGLMTIGVARLLAGSRAALGVLWIVIGGSLVAQIRPHLLVVVAIALMASAMASPRRNVGRRGALFRLFLLLIMIPVMVSAVGRMDTVLGTSSGGSLSIDETFNENIERTSRGGSAFQATPVRIPLDVPQAAVTVLYRPFLFEANNVAMLVSAVEGMVLLILTAIAARWLWYIGPVMYRSPFAAYCGGFVLAFVVAFSSIANAGILSRQRVQVYPLVMLLACAAREQHRSRATGDPEPDARPTSPAQPSSVASIG